MDGVGLSRKVSRRARSAIRNAELLVSPVVLVELEYLHEIGRMKPTAREVIRKLHAETGLQVSDALFVDVMQVALDEKWTRDPFDRIIVAHARFDALAPLLSADEHIQANYPRVIW